MYSVERQSHTDDVLVGGRRCARAAIVLVAAIASVVATGSNALAQTRTSPQAAAPAGDAGGIEIDRLGIMVAPSSEGTQVTAVRQDGPAFLAGLQPGDVLVRVGTLTGPTPQSLASLVWNQVRRLVRHAHSTVEVVDVEARYMARGTPQSLNAPVRIWIGAQGAWIATRLDHANAPGSPRQELPGVIEARAIPARYDAQYEQTIDKIASNPCGMSGQTDPLAIALGRPPAGYESAHMLRDNFRGMTYTGCTNVKDPLPEFESLLVAMVAGDLDACAYKPGADVSAALARARLRATKESYDTPVARETPSAQWLAGNACARAFIVSQITRGSAATSKP